MIFEEKSTKKGKRISDRGHREHGARGKSEARSAYVKTTADKNPKQCRNCNCKLGKRWVLGGRCCWVGQRNYLFADGRVEYLKAEDICMARDYLPDANLTFDGIKGIDWPAE
jgi:prepilin-type processing-associated H-X9-DG protein